VEAKATCICDKKKFNLTTLIRIEEVSKLIFSIVVRTPAFESLYKNSVVSQENM
jgi:hypothetical protein